MNKGFFAFASATRARGCKLAVVSNDSSRWSAYLREKFALNPCFDVVSISGDLKISKPDPRIFQLTLDKLGCAAADCAYVDDRTGNLAAAQKLGMEPVLFNSRSSQFDGKTVQTFEELSALLL